MAHIDGTGGRDDLHGTPNGDTIMAKGGSDFVHAGAGNDVVHGGGDQDFIYGQDGADTLWGDEGNDIIEGGAGRDTLIGGDGADALTGGAGADTFVFRSIAEFHTPSGDYIDSIADFSRAENDRIDLSAIDANWNRSGDQAFTFLGETAFTGHAGELVFKRTSDLGHNWTTVMVDVDGDARFDMYTVLDGNHALTASDFIL